MPTVNTSFNFENDTDFSVYNANNGTTNTDPSGTLYDNQAEIDGSGPEGYTFVNTDGVEFRWYADDSGDDNVNTQIGASSNSQNGATDISPGSLARYPVQHYQRRKEWGHGCARCHTGRAGRGSARSLHP